MAFDDDEVAKAEQDRALRHDLKEHKAMLRWMLSQKPARRFLAWLMFDPATANLHGSVFDRDVVAMATKVGIQQVGLAVQTQLMETDFNQFLEVLAEYRVLQETIPEVKHE